MKQWPSLFGAIHPTSFIIYKANIEVTSKFSDQIEYYKGNGIDLAFFPYEIISDHFLANPE